MNAVHLEATVSATNSEPPWHILRFPKEAVASFGFKGSLRRVVCTLNSVETLQCALFPAGDDYFITLSKKLRKKLGLEIGDLVTMEISKDESKYGMPVPEEFAEVLRQDPEGERLFNALSPGNQRLMLKLIVFVKDSDRRIARSLAGIELLKRSVGEFVYDQQHAAMRIAASTKPKDLID